MSDLIRRVPRSGCLRRPPRPRPTQLEAPEPAQAELVICDYTIERTFAWLMRYRRLRADYETEPASSRGWILIAAIHRMARRLIR
jgi:transposase